MTPGLRRIFEEHRDDRARELYEIANILDQQGLTPDAGPIRQAAYQCKNGLKNIGGRDYWGFEIADLHINLDTQRHGHPYSAVVDGCVGVLSVRVEEYVPASEESVGHSFDLLRHAGVEFYFDTVHEQAGDVLPLRAAWHLDTHEYTNDNDHGVHPRFHFHIGGHGLKEIDNCIRGVLIPDAPRLPCAPLDAILAIDFVLSHYCGRKWNEFKDILPDYGRLRRGPIQRYWLPYFRTIADSIDGLDRDPGGGSGFVLLPNIGCG